MTFLLELAGLVAVAMVGAIGAHEFSWWWRERERRRHALRRRGDWL